MPGLPEGLGRDPSMLVQVWGGDTWRVQSPGDTQSSRKIRGPSPTQKPEQAGQPPRPRPRRDPGAQHTVLRVTQPDPTSFLKKFTFVNMIFTAPKFKHRKTYEYIFLAEKYPISTT